jgi:tetratricopeptide (TPR) repeat protein
MTDNSRIEDLRRRVQKDPASIAFAQLAEEYRRAGQFDESVEACRAGLAVHPAYLSARVTLGRALIELDRFDEAEQELSQVLKSAPDNLAAIRGTADIHRQRGNLAKALEYYRSALQLAKNDPDLQETVADLTKKIAPTREAELKDGLTLDDMHRELTARAALPPQEITRPHAVPPRTPTPVPAPVAPVAATRNQTDRDRALRTIAALEQWLGAIHAARPQPAA